MSSNSFRLGGIISHHDVCPRDRKRLRYRRQASPAIAQNVVLYAVGSSCMAFAIPASPLSRSLPMPYSRVYLLPAKCSQFFQPNRAAIVRTTSVRDRRLSSGSLSLQSLRIVSDLEKIPIVAQVFLTAGLRQEIIGALSKAVSDVLRHRTGVENTIAVSRPLGSA